MTTTNNNTVRAYPAKVSVQLWDPNSPDATSLRQQLNPATSKIVHFVRHGQGYHNFMDTELQRAGAVISDVDDYTLAVAEERFYLQPALQDPPLTAQGRHDAKKLWEYIASLDPGRFSPELYIVSPLRRATQTVLLAFHSLLSPPAGEHSPPVPVVALESCREQCGIYYSDKRSDVSDFAMEFPRVCTEHMLSDEDVLWQPRERESMDAQLARQQDFLQFMWKHEDVREVVVGTHSGWLRALVNRSLVVAEAGEASSIQKDFRTGEMRSLLMTWTDSDCQSSAI